MKGEVLIIGWTLFTWHSIGIHYKEKSTEELQTHCVYGKNVPVPHYGVVLPWKEFESFAKNLSAKGVQLVITPYIKLKDIWESKKLYFSQVHQGTLLNYSF